MTNLIALKAQSNSLHAQEEIARKANDIDSMLAILERLIHVYRLMGLEKVKEGQEK